MDSTQERLGIEKWENLPQLEFPLGSTTFGPSVVSSPTWKQGRTDIVLGMLIGHSNPLTETLEKCSNVPCKLSRRQVGESTWKTSRETLLGKTPIAREMKPGRQQSITIQHTVVRQCRIHISLVIKSRDVMSLQGTA